jgi:basic membrane protein A
MNKRLLSLLVLLGILLTLAAQCGPPASQEAAAPAGEQSEPASSAQAYKLAAIFPGVITDADYNTLGYIAATSVQSELGVKMAYSESVAVPDVDRVMREYIDDGFNIIFTHGSQFVSQTQDLAKEFPDVHFIAESDAPAEDPPPNLWTIDRNFHVGFYALGVVAGRQSKTGKIGYLGGLTLPFSYAEVHAIEQALADQGLEVEFKPVWAGDFNDPTKARELAEAMMAEDIDVIIGSLNLGMFGLFEAVKSSPNQVWATAKYTDKTQFAPENYLTSVLYDFSGPLNEIVSKIEAGEGGGYYPLGFDTGVEIQPLKNASPDLESELGKVVSSIQAGEITVEKDTTPIEE